MKRVSKPFMPEMRELPDQYGHEAYRKFPHPDKPARDKGCADLEALAQFEGMDVEAALEPKHRALLAHVHHHRRDGRA